MTRDIRPSAAEIEVKAANARRARDTYSAGSMGRKLADDVVWLAEALLAMRRHEADEDEEEEEDEDPPAASRPPAIAGLKVTCASVSLYPERSVAQFDGADSQGYTFKMSVSLPPGPAKFQPGEVYRLEFTKP